MLFLPRLIFLNMIDSKSDETGILDVLEIKMVSSLLKVQSCRLYNNKYMIASTQITNSETFAVVAVLVFKLLTLQVLFTNRKDNINC